MNKSILKGRFVKNPEVSYSEGIEPVCFARFSIAVEDRGRKDNDKYHVDYVPCIAIGKTAEIIEAHCIKGQEILLFGKIQTGTYEKDGTKHYTVDFCVQELEFCGKKEPSDN
ncbi:single-stranded DNA-binding protein [[Clostridium] fimetarium]|uniref:Single-stranded DNA-binding protein n=1 Tax=[Clostridium] fimetarium TaxID=99656 RepID=A0A1I0QWF9_9FIRM|nr:single-stranded DNA-binding protein [[Clostridium] fimetarium]SEW31836.1 single-strand DNA-binding protein [[Clostridium] fimetarium]